MKKVLLLGAGLVAKPLIEYLLENGLYLMVASPMKERADAMIKGHPHGESLLWSMDEQDKLHEMINEHDITVSLLPPSFHTSVAKICIELGKSMVNTSYVSGEMRVLDFEARKKGVLLLNEAGLDPGIDHMSAMKIIDKVHRNGGKVSAFYSICGALPAPEAADNPMKYKFTWSPVGVLRASKNGAHYRKNGKEVFIDPENLFRDRYEVNLPETGLMEVYPNRDSISYIDIYGIPETETMYRGTFRYPGWCETLDLMKTINILDETEQDYTGRTYMEFTAQNAGLIGTDLKSELCRKFNLDPESQAIKAFNWLGLFSNEKMGHGIISPFGIISSLMIRKMSLAQNERDMVVLQHTFNVHYPGGKREVIKSSMVDFGNPAGNTSIARTVAYPAAVATKLILENKIRLSGVYRPVVPEIYEPVMPELEKLGIKMKEETELLQ
jgi:saccharopine dehydrogenase-like NADP-dependent oxidoreductase